MTRITECLLRSPITRRTSKVGNYPSGEQQIKTKQIILSEDNFLDSEVAGNATITINEVLFSERKPKTLTVKIIEKNYTN